MAQHFPGSPVPVLGQYPGNKTVGGEVGLETAQISPTNLSLPWKAPRLQPALVSVLLGLVLAQASVPVIGRCSGRSWRDRAAIKQILPRRLVPLHGCGLCQSNFLLAKVEVLGSRLGDYVKEGQEGTPDCL